MYYFQGGRAISPEDAAKIGTRLASKQTEERMRAVGHLRRIADADAQTLLLKTLKDRSHYVGALAAEALAECADERLLPQLIALFDWFAEDGLGRDTGCHIRGHLAVLFGRMEAQSAVDALRVGIKTRQMEAVGGIPTDTAVHLRANCALALAQLRPPDALRDIALLLFDEGKGAITHASNAKYVTIECRKAAAQALAHLANPQGIVPLAIKLTYPEDEAPEVLQECLQAVVDLEDERGMELIAPYLSHSDAHLAAFACLMVARAHDPQAPFLILRTLSRLTGDPLEAAILALSTLRTEDAHKMLKELAESDRKDVRRIVKELGF